MFLRIEDIGIVVHEGREWRISSVDSQARTAAGEAMELWAIAFVDPVTRQAEVAVFLGRAMRDLRLAEIAPDTLPFSLN